MAHQKVGVFIPEAMMSPTFGRTGSRVWGVGVSIVAHGHRVGPFTWFHRLVPTRPVMTASAPLPATVDVTFVGQP
jgi:hypothetical protein